ncbi:MULTISPECIES: hypothetical protein [Paenibacillus]|uniref:hypothetical protein n=1 Tax=Paenibacillus TaxID=44249 RepID=UPI0009EEBDDE|nr:MULTISPECIES: hypothetical protein [Paenibacillus]GIP20438.1 hypothetical protein J22TS3_07130 [Paenibacillus sp. J22TS3]
MAKIGIISEYNVYAEAPSLLLVKLSPAERDWSSMLYLKVAPPWEHFELEEFGDASGITVLLEDITVLDSEDHIIGVNLPQIYRRHQVDEVDQLVIRLQDVEEVLGAYM